MKRKPGYVFEISLTEKRTTAGSQVDAITDAQIEIYNNTKSILTQNFSNSLPYFNINLEQGNHYTLLIRKKGYFPKKMEINLDINGCIICFDGVSKLMPGFKSNLNDDLTIGNYSAFIEMNKILTNQIIMGLDIDFKSGITEINSENKKEIDKISDIVRFNPTVKFEIGVHTDSRGSELTNQKLSEQRAINIFKYLTNTDNEIVQNLDYKGYGESQLINKCRDNIPCSEIEHIRNRRVELKVIAEFHDSRLRKESLVEIIKRSKNVQNDFKNPGINDANNKNADNTEFLLKSEITTEQESPVNITYNEKQMNEFLVIAGSYSIESNALKMKEILKSMDINARVIKNDENDYFRVIAGIFSAESEARSLIKKLRQNDIDCFILN